MEEGITFTPAHRRLWAEFMGRVALPPNVRELYARTESVLQRSPGLSLLNAWDRDGHLAACLLLDSAPRRFTSYLLGAHSRIHFTSRASDLLFREMIRMARRDGKEFLHLGLGVNDGIRRFKTKWGGVPGLPYEMARWREREGLREGVGDLMRMLAAMPREPMSKREFLASLPPQRTFAMLWEIEKNGRRSWIAGTAHFFCFSFESSFRELFEKVDTVLFEGPLDPASLDQVSAIGRTPGPESPRVAEALTEEDIRRLERVVCGPRGFWARLVGAEHKNPPDVRHLLSDTRPLDGLLFVVDQFPRAAGLDPVRGPGSLAPGPGHGQNGARNGEHPGADRNPGEHLHRPDSRLPPAVPSVEPIHQAQRPRLPQGRRGEHVRNKPRIPDPHRARHPPAGRPVSGTHAPFIERGAARSSWARPT